jgi:hypothetical protein
VAERRVRRRPRWRGGHPRPSPLCVHLLVLRVVSCLTLRCLGRSGHGESSSATRE